ncbi:MAG: signal recognition particle protein [Eubacteriaceae bacterium]|nr:signal recognition particle protein [Eubacteriaceae bacterium]
MFDSLSEKVQGAFKKLRGKGKLTEKDIDEALKEIRMALLEADVNFKVVKVFLSDIREKCLGEEVFSSLTPGQTVIKIVHGAMSDLLGTTAKDLKLGGNPSVIMLAGVQGSGKTTSAAKLALYLKRKNKLVVLAACDTQRAAAAKQLEILSKEIGIDFFTAEGKSPEQIATDALGYSRLKGADVLIVDTAGRQHVDDDLMDEISRINDAAKPSERLFVVDCMMGQQAVDAAKSFNDRLELTGFILSKADSDSRGGAALSVTHATGKPIKFTGSGEKVSDFEQFHPDRVASRILGMGDVMSLIDKAQAVYDEEAAEKMAKKMVEGSFTLEDYLDQIEQISNMGGIGELLKSFPANAKLGEDDFESGTQELARTKAIIQSMTVKERNNPAIINASRKRRIAAGSGTMVSDVNRLLKGFEQSKKLIKAMSSGRRGGIAPGRMNLPFM